MIVVGNCCHENPSAESGAEKGRLQTPMLPAVSTSEVRSGAEKGRQQTPMLPAVLASWPLG
jgi:ribosomal protein S30